MGRHPWREWFVFSVAWLVLLIPVIRLTADKPKDPDIGPQDFSPAEFEAHPAWATVRFTEAPSFFRVSQLGREIWSLTNSEEGENDQEVNLHLEDDIAELRVEVIWQTPGNHVVELSIAPDGYEERQRHAWGTDRINQIFVYSWKARAKRPAEPNPVDRGDP